MKLFIPRKPLNLIVGGLYNNGRVIIMAEMAVILHGLAPSNHGETYGL